MTDKLTVFTYNKLPVSVIQDDTGEPWWIIKEVCKVLNIADPTSAVRNLADDEKLLRSLCGTGGQRRDVITVNEPGLYRLIMRSNKKEARELWEWWEVDKDVRDHYRNKTDSILSLPALREALEKATGTCVWAEEDGIVQTGCGTELWFDDIVDDHYAKQCPFCPCCGRRIEVKDEQG